LVDGPATAIGATSAHEQVGAHGLGQQSGHVAFAFAAFTAFTAFTSNSDGACTAHGAGPPHGFTSSNLAGSVPWGTIDGFTSSPLPPVFGLTVLVEGPATAIGFTHGVLQPHGVGLEHAGFVGVGSHGHFAQAQPVCLLPGHGPLSHLNSVEKAS
jgi:hypothetical protein